MTNPNNVSNIVAPIPAENVTAVAYFKPSGFVTSGNAWFGAKDGSIYVAQFSPMGNRFVFRCRMQTAKLNYQVKRIVPVQNPACTLVQWIGGNNQPGPVQVIYPGAVRVQICAEASHIRLYKNQVLVINENKVNIYEFQASVLLYKTQQTLQDVPTALDVCGNFLVYYGAGCYYQLNLADYTTSKIFSSVVRKPFVYRVQDNLVYLGDNDFIRTTALDGKEPGQLQYDRTLRIPNYMLIHTNCIYQFFQKKFTRAEIGQADVNDTQIFNIADVQKAAMVEDCLLIVSNKAIQLVGTMEEPSALAAKVAAGQSAEIDSLLSKLPKEQSSQTALEIFDSLWRQNKKKEAIELLSRNVVFTDVNRIVSLVPILITPAAPVTNETNADLKPLDENDKSLLEPMLKFLSFKHDNLRNKVKYLVEYRHTNTALSQCYSAFSKTRELDALIKEGKLDRKILQLFLVRRNKTMSVMPGIAVLKSNVGEINDAMNIWHQLDDALKQKGQINSLFISEASYTLQMSKDSTNLAAHLDWIYERDPNKPELALNAILSVNHDSEIVDQWIKSKGLDNLKLRYSVFIVTQPSTSRGSALANETFITLLDILNQIDESGYDIKKLQFTQAYIKGPNDADIKKKAKEEIVQYELQILVQHAASISKEEVKAHFSDKIDRRVVFAVYRVTGEYETGIGLLTADNKFPQEEIEEFCRFAIEPPKAFSVLLKGIKPEELVSKYYNFILNNIAYMDLPELIKLIPRTLRVKEVQVLTKKCYNLLQSRLNSLNTQIAVTKSMQVDVNYQKVHALANYHTHELDAKCAACGQDVSLEQPFVMAPGGINQPIYHTKCKPTLIT